MRWMFSIGLITSACGWVWADPPALKKLNPKQLDALIAKSLPGDSAPLSDEFFLRRAHLDLIGRPPTPDEVKAFADDKATDKRLRLVDSLLASKEFGQHWANYWTDTISYKVPPPELTFLNYTRFKAWLADKFNQNVAWDKITQEILSASGDIKKNPAVTFIGYHQGRPAKLAAETARVFLSLQLQCAECHDHKFDSWTREEFHGLAAFFGRVSGKLGKAQDGSSTEVKDLGKGEYVMPNVRDPKKKGQTMAPVLFTGQKLDLDTPDQVRRDHLAKWLTLPSNPYFAKAFVNRVWARLMGRGFYEPVDNLADYVEPVLTDLHKDLADHFIASNFDIKGFYRLLASTEAYQRSTPVGTTMAKQASSYGKTAHLKLNGDEVFKSLTGALGLPNVTPKATKPTDAIRFPPPPKSTRDIVADKFGYDPNSCGEEVSRTLGQAMLLMNNEQVQKQINADPASGTRLAKMVQQEKNDRVLVVRLFYQVLSRQPTEQEIGIALEHLGTVGQRGPAFEDLLWSLINSAEFTSKR